MELKKKAEGVKTRADLVKFLAELNSDLKNHRENWENSTLESYIEALSAWVEDCDGYYLNQRKSVPENPSWKFLAEMMLAAKYYE